MKRFNVFFAISTIAYLCSVITTIDADAPNIELDNFEMSVIKHMFNNYDWRVRPIGLNSSMRHGGPIIITTNIFLRTISKIDDVNMEYSTQFTFRESWVDPRLAYERLSAWQNAELIPEFLILVTGDQRQQIWMPDTFFQNEKTAQRHMIDKPNVLIRIYKNGTVLYSVRLSLTLSCPMSLLYYPMDRQTCVIDLASYAYTTDDIIYIWKDDNPIQLKDTVSSSLPTFDLVDVSTGSCTSQTNTGEYSCLRTELHFKRMFSYYLLQLYIPSFMLVIVSWVSFWVDKASVPARVTLGVTTLLTITTQASGINAKLPPVSYTKAIDVWIGVCLAFVFGALLEYALVNYAGNQEDKKLCRKVPSGNNNIRGPEPFLRQPAQTVNSPTSTSKDSTPIAYGSPKDSADYRLLKCDQNTPLNSRESYGNNGRRDDVTVPLSISLLPPSASYHKRTNRFNLYNRLIVWVVKMYREADRSKKIDVVSRFVFPLLFMIFNCLYWVAYTTSKNTLDN